MQEDLILSAWGAEAGWYGSPAVVAKQQQQQQQQQQLGLHQEKMMVADMDKISRSGLSELEKMTREQQQQHQLAKTSRQQQQQQPVGHHPHHLHQQHHKTQQLESRPSADQRSYIDQLRSQDQKSFQEQLRAQERRAQSDSSGRSQQPDTESAARFQVPTSRGVGYHHPHHHADVGNKVADPARTHLDVLAQFSQQLAGKTAASETYGRSLTSPPPVDKLKGSNSRQSHDHHLLPPSDARSAAARGSLHQGEPAAKKAAVVEPLKLGSGDLRSQYDLLSAYAANENLRMQAVAQQQTEQQQQHLQYHQGAYQQQQHEAARDQLPTYPGVTRDSLQEQQQQLDPTSFSCQKQQQQQSMYMNKNGKDMSALDPFRRVVSPPLQPSRTKPTSPRQDSIKPATSFSSSCRIEQQQQKQQQEQELFLQQQQQQQFYGIPSATPADKLPGFVPSVPHARDQKRQSHEGAGVPPPPSQAHHDHGVAESQQQQQRKGRDTPASVAGSDASHNSAPTSGIPNELLDSVLETAKLPVWRPPESATAGGSRPDNLKMASPAKPPQASPPKSAPVMSSDRDNTSALEELVKHIDASPSPRDSTRTVSSNPSLTPSHLPYGSGGKKDAAGHHPQQHLPHQHPNLPPHLGESTTASPSQLVYSNIPELMGSAAPQAAGAGGGGGGHHSDRDLSEAERSDYDNEQHDKGGVDYYDEEDDDEDDLPLGARRRGVSLVAVTSKPLAVVAAPTDISSWGQAAPTVKTTTKELKIKLGPPPPSPPPQAAVKDVPQAIPKPETLTKRGTRVPCYREEPEEEATEAVNKKPVVAKVPCYKEAQSQLSSSLPAQPAGGNAAARGKVKGGRGAGANRLFGRKSGPKYDQKAFDEVHRKLAGTDFDIEGEFDDFGDAPKEDGLVSLRDFRVASKNKRNESFGSDGGDFDFSTTTSNQMPPLQFDDGGESAEEEKPVVAAAPTKGKGRAAKSKKSAREVDKELENSPDQPKVIPLKIKNKSAVSVEEEVVVVSHPKIPRLTIKLGPDRGRIEPSLLRQVRKAERHSKMPVEEEEEKPSLKVKIRVPRKPVAPLERPHNGDIPLSDNPLAEDPNDPVIGLVREPAQDLTEPPRLIVRPVLAIDSPRRDKSAPRQTTGGRTPVQDKNSDSVITETALLQPLERIKTDTPIRSSPIRDPGSEKATITITESAPAEANDVAPPSGMLTEPSPRKPKGGSSIDSLANKLLAKQQSSSELTVSQASELVAIFGPEEPLSVNLIDDHPPPAAAAGADRPDDGPSELDLLTMELKKLEREQQQKDETAAAAKYSTTTEEGLAEPATLEIVSVLATDKLESDLRLENYDEGAHSKIHHHQLKYKFKPQQLHQPPPGEQRSSSPVPGPSSHLQPPVKINLTHHSGSSSSAAASVVDIHMRRMRKKELLNSYLGIEAPVQLPAVLTNGPSNAHYQSDVPTREVVRMNIIKMPKAVASVTSVPTRADYQSQLEANMERKRKREGKEDLVKVKGQKKGKGKQGRKDDWEEAYRPKLKKTADSGEESETKGEPRVRTRGKPPKKCLREESPEREGPLDSFKKTNLRYAEEVRKQFDLEGEGDVAENKLDDIGLEVAGRGVVKEEQRRRKEKKRRREEEGLIKEELQPKGKSPRMIKEELLPKGKSPRIVIKISKNKDSASKVIGKDSNGLTQPVAAPTNDIQSLKVQPIKIKL